MTLYAATGNAGKLAEFAHCASTAGFTVLALPGLAAMPEPVEDAATFIGNAELKARAYSLLAPGKLVLADDSGLEVDALGGDPGVRSARFAQDSGFTTGGGTGDTDDTKDARNNALLLQRLAALPARIGRSGRFVCALAVARDGQVLFRSEAFCSGMILPAPRGAEGFGYDPLFLVPSLGLTMAELPREQKWAVSHRGNAFRQLLATLAKSHTVAD